MTQTEDWIDRQRCRRAVRWMVAYCAALRERRAVRLLT